MSSHPRGVTTARSSWRKTTVVVEDSKIAGVQGVVILEATIGPDGRVDRLVVLRSIPQLDYAAIEAVKEWEFTPTMLNGTPVPVTMTVTVNFSLN